MLQSDIYCFGKCILDLWKMYSRSLEEITLTALSGSLVLPPPPTHPPPPKVSLYIRHLPFLIKLVQLFYFLNAEYTFPVALSPW